MSNLMDYLPAWYQDSPETVSFQKAIQPELDMIWAARNDLLLQLNPNTATWGLAYWEKALGLVTDESNPAEYRRSRIISKLRGSGTTTVALIKEVSESFTNGQVEVIECYADYLVQIKFANKIGVPPNLDDLKAALDEIMPEHLTWEFVLTFRTHGELQAYTHGELAAFTHKTIREEDLTNAADNEL